MLCVQVRLSTMRTRELAVRILNWRHLALAVDLTNGCAARSARKDTTTSLAPDNVSGLFALLKRSLLHHGATSRHDAGLVHNAGHRPQDGGTSTARRSRGRGDGLWVRHGLGRLRHAERVG